jgi:ribosomal protein S18 acetylase RimI-like enzyme
VVPHAVEIRPAVPADVDGLAGALGRAFTGDPGWGWIYPQPDRGRRLGRMFRTLLRVVLARGATVLTDAGGHGAAIWQRSDARSFGLLGTARVGAAMVASGARTRRGQALLQTIERHHPAAPHWYLATLGADPQHQGSGLGSALVRHVLDDPAHAHEAAYLETLSAGNVPFYEQFGFTVTGEADVPDGGPHVWFLWRDPPG